MSTTESFYAGIGKRKTSVAKIFLTEGSGKICINNKSFEDFFSGVMEERESIKKPFVAVNLLNQYDSIFIDEGQFFPDLYSFVSDLVDNYRKHVIVSGLDGDSNRNTFGELIKLIPICDTVDKLHAYCNKCNNGRIAPFTKKIKEDTVLIDIGGINKYIPVCRYHYLNR
jgi:thymidine kinase